MADRIKVSKYILERLEELRCKRVYGVPAASASNFFEEIETGLYNVKVVNTSSELEAGYAADGYGRANGFGATAVSYGVGTQCFVNAVAGALVERVPMIVINGGPTQKELDTEAMYGVLFTHSTGRLHSDLKILSKVTLAAKRLEDLATMGDEIDSLFVKAIAELGPVYLELGNDVFEDLIEPPAKPLSELIPKPDARGLEAVVEKALGRLADAKHPVFLVGVEVVRNRELPEVLLRLLDKWKFPYFTTLLGKSALSEDHDRFAGTFDSDLAPTSIHDVLYESDCIISLGCVFGVSYTGLVTTKNASMIRVGFDQGRVENVIFEGVPLKDFMEALVSAASREETTARSAAAAPEYPKRYVDRRYHWVKRVQRGATDSQYLTHDEIFQVLDDFLRAHAETPYTMMVDTCLGSYPGADLPIMGPHKYLADSAWLSIGWSAGACIGVSQDSGRRPVVVVGDGGFQTIAQCISTIARYELPVIMIIIDNALYAIEQFVLDPCFFLDESSKPYSFVNLNQWDYTAMAQLFGIEKGGAFKVDNRTDLHSLLERAHDDPAGTYVIAARVATHNLPPENLIYAESHCTGGAPAGEPTRGRRYP